MKKYILLYIIPLLIYLFIAYTICNWDKQDMVIVTAFSLLVYLFVFFIESIYSTNKNKLDNLKQLGFGYYKGSLVRIIRIDEKEKIAEVCFANCDVPDTNIIKLSELKYKS